MFLSRDYQVTPSILWPEGTAVDDPGDRLTNPDTREQLAVVFRASDHAIANIPIRLLAPRPQR